MVRNLIRLIRLIIGKKSRNRKARTLLERIFYPVCLTIGHKKSRRVVYARGEKWPRCGRCGSRLQKPRPVE